MASSYREMEDKWQKRWSERKLDHADRNERPKFMVIFAYPGVTGYLHVGHMRGFTYVDAIGRYKRMTGHNVLFPVGTHATGNGAITLASRISRKEEGVIEYLKRNGCTDRDLKKLKDPMSVVNFFNDVYVNEYWKRFGFLADWRRFTCTLYPDYAKFMQWQFMKLNDAGLLIQKPYFAPACTQCGPVAIDASETDIAKGGNAETQEYTLLKFRYGDMYLVAATLRPETVYGQVNFWANPDVEYVKMRKGNETWVVSPSAARKLAYQKDDCEIIGKINGRDMVGWMCEAPMIHRNVPVFPAGFCDPNVGTGLVTSVPSDAPDDWMSLQDVKNDPRMISEYGLTREQIDSAVPISIISMEGYGDFPAKDVIVEMGIERSGDPRLADAKKQVYKDGYHTGRMKDVCGKFAGLRVEEAKDRMKEEMISSGEAELFHDLNEEVICRCGNPVMIRRVDDQWFINYADEGLTRRTSDHCRTMEINPVEYQNNVHGVLDWFRERACVRQGNWLGTKFPLDERWTIEAISDSTLYPIYYIISIYANDGTIRPEQMTGSFFDHVVLQKGDADDVSKETGIPKDILSKIQKDVLYWYPLDLNLGGKEHMTVHFPTFLFNHAAILPDELLPRGIMVNWYVTGKKSKISKSKGGAQPIPGAAGKFGVDSLRLYYAHVASLFADVEWDEGIVMSYRQRLDRIIGMVEELSSITGTDNGDINGWLISRSGTHMEAVHEGMRKLDLRSLASETYFEMFNDMKWYLRRGGRDQRTIRDVLRMWISAMAPITPHIAEELWETCGFEGLVSEYEFPGTAPGNMGAEFGETLIRDVISDISQIIKVTRMDPKRVIIYTTQSWKVKAMGIALELASSGKLDIPTLTKMCMSDPAIRENGKAASELAKKLAVDMSRTSNEGRKALLQINEKDHLSSAAEFISSEIGVKVEVMSADDADYDPQGKSKAAIPGRPAIYLE
ncbi:MAG: leucine--tRNA ligase [Methanomassiliicoccaceae archaeon]|jgi:leucyl-tRNA synthetase|nr:leucine--tRNA ligase [Methanomassiliicoccaceae archaeon]